MNDVSIPTRMTRSLGLRHPFANAGMGFIAHERLAAAVTNAGGLGVLGASPDPPESLPVMVERLLQLTSGPFGVDLICAQTGLGPASTDAHIDECVRLSVPLVIFHHDPPPAEWVRRLVQSGAQVWMQVSSVDLAAAAIELGVNGLVAQGSEAGGHSRGTVALHSLLGKIRHRYPDVLMLGAGGIADGAAVAAALRAGADGVWVGSRLIASTEANAHQEYRRRLVESAGETVRTTAFGPEWPDEQYRLLATPTAAQWAGRERDIPADVRDGTIGRTRLFPHSVNIDYTMPAFSALPPTPETTGDWEAMAYPAGQGVGMVHAIAPATDIVAEMMSEARALLDRQPAPTR